MKRLIAVGVCVSLLGACSVRNDIETLRQMDNNMSYRFVGHEGNTTITDGKRSLIFINEQTNEIVKWVGSDSDAIEYLLYLNVNKCYTNPLDAQRQEVPCEENT